MSEDRRRSWRPDKAFSDLVDRQINKAIAKFAEQVEMRGQQATEDAVAAIEGRLSDLAHRIEVRAQLASLEVLKEAERKSTHRTEVGILALRDELLRQITHEVESRAEVAGLEARAYADSSVHALSLAIAAANRVVAQTAKRLVQLQRSCNDIQTHAADVEVRFVARLDQLEDLAHRGSDIETQTAERIDGVAGLLEDVQARTTAASEQIAAQVDGVVTQLAELAHHHSQALARIEELTAFRDSFLGGEAEWEWLQEVKHGLVGLQGKLDSAIADYNGQLRNAEQRIEFVRTETLFELQAGLVKTAIQRPSPVQHDVNRPARIINREKVASYSQSGLRLNVGCGHIQPDGYVNVDAREVAGIDIVAEATNIPFSKGEVAEIFASHLVEHFSQNILHRVLLPHWYDLLEQGGVLTTIVPDGTAMIEALGRGEMKFDDFREVLFGTQDYDGDYHYNILTVDSFQKSLEQAGFVQIEIEYSGKRNGKCFEFKITARKP